MKIDKHTFAIALIAALAFWLVSCKTTRKISESKIEIESIKKVDSASISKVDSGSLKTIEATTIKKGDSSIKETHTWFRDTYISNDTAIYKTIIKEGGTIIKNNYYNLFDITHSKMLDSIYKSKKDSLFKSVRDSLAVISESKKKDSKTSLFGFWQIMAVAILAFFAIVFFWWLKK